ncbi:RHS repeat-associated core domain-containing protein [Acinetobacter sp. ULE_I057]
MKYFLALLKLGYKRANWLCDRFWVQVSSFGNYIAEEDFKNTFVQQSPFGQQLQYKKPSNLKNPNAFVGGVQDADDLVYLKQRHYNPVLGRFYQPDPVTFIMKGHGQTNRYQYGWNDSYSFKDPDGKEARDYLGQTEFNTDFYDHSTFSVPSAKAGFSYLKNNIDYHIYNRSVFVSGLSEMEILNLRFYLIQHPTPNDNAQPATIGGTFNLANPSGFNFRTFMATSKTLIHNVPDNVYSFLRTGNSGVTWVVNITRPDHSLYPGIVIRGVQDLGGGNVLIHNYGEGTGKLQSLGWGSDKVINNIWYDATKSALKTATGRDYKINIK